MMNGKSRTYPYLIEKHQSHLDLATIIGKDIGDGARTGGAQRPTGQAKDLRGLRYFYST